MNILRGTAYVLTSLASALFIVLVIYGYVQLSALGERLQNLVPGTASLPSITEPAPPADASGEEIYCFYNPEDPTCTP